jgi:hypothetical protein
MAHDDPLGARLRQNMMHAMVEAHLGGHDLTDWEPAQEGETRRFRATCRKCGKGVDVSAVAIYGVLADACPGK